MSTESPHSSPELDTGLICLAMLARFHNIAISTEQLSHEFSTS
ncbi:cysteine peptidase family C39 domain-containing protein, partial [Photorhabdus namnaonensis]